MPVALSAIEPRYPFRARTRGEEGRVTLRVEVDAEGHATEAAVTASSGSELLDGAAMDAVRRSRFRPAQRDGRRVPGETALAFEFKLTP
jgi:protein TonB